jgi:2,3-bisphosphoglycerate-independent phosphoglycerate mutase
MVNPRTGSPDTEHTTNPVPFIIASPDPGLSKVKLKMDGVLASIAPTVLEICGVPKPTAMRNQSLIINERNL